MWKQFPQSITKQIQRYIFISTNLNIIMETKEAPKVASLGKPQPVELKLNGGGTTQQETPQPKNEGEAGQTGAEETKPETKNGPSFEEIQAYMKGQGIEVSSMDEIKAKFAPPAPEATEEEKKKKETDTENKMVAKFIAEGGTIEQYAALKNVLGMDDKELATTTALKELKDAGFSDDEAKEIIASRYYQLDVDGLKRDEDNEDEPTFEKRKAALQKKSTYGQNKLNGRSKMVKTNAETILNNLRKGVEADEAAVTREATFLANVDKSLSSFTRKMEIDLGKENDQQIVPVQFEFTDDHIAAVKAILSDPAKRKQYYLNEDGTIDPEKAVQLVMKIEALTSIGRASFFEGRTRTVKDFQSRFPSNPHQLGVGGSKSKADPSKIVKAGNPVRVTNS